ncbi:hypothetical protein ACKKBF_B12415 [Auxenochlorella protothecoides x Auxenochlorella symbiontica]
MDADDYVMVGQDGELEERPALLKDEGAETPTCQTPPPSSPLPDEGSFDTNDNTVRDPLIFAVLTLELIISCISCIFQMMVDFVDYARPQAIGAVQKLIKKLDIMRQETVSATGRPLPHQAWQPSLRDKGMAGRLEALLAAGYKVLCKRSGHVVSVALDRPQRVAWASAALLGLTTLAWVIC